MGVAGALILLGVAMPNPSGVPDLAPRQHSSSAIPYPLLLSSKYPCPKNSHALQDNPRPMELLWSSDVASFDPDGLKVIVQHLVPCQSLI